MASLIDKIKELRELTGAGMMDCKKALVENGEDVDKAKDWLREQGITTAAKKSGRIAAEGLALAKIEDGYAAIVEVNCETDFVSRGDDFKALVNTVLDLLLKHKPANKEAADAIINPLLVEATVKIGEKLSFRRFELVKVEDRGATYIHMGGKIATVVLLDKKNDELAHGLTMHIAANSPSYITTDDITEEDYNHERGIQLEITKNDPRLADKPEKMLKNIVEGKIRKYFSDLVLAEQTYLMDDTKKVGQALKDLDNKVLVMFRYQVGEGIEKRQEDFAAEVFGQIK
ncbi:MAG: translation elongation factor Ts [Bacilli bacterium]|jgi:elongation factor Ts|nr:translation elongation factor Ts [Bacillota bacterium]NLI51950.1 elongation factor Ts [Erysipelotrichaceae bacterium]OQC49818.1 MAG: Elongation factor Ts [Tenericutes bacterium ADurb.Bin024]HOA10989.1 translation elongation factor Ts [Bacilli bacterium]HOE53728.1 translation elongation factor Ts [Bacilli bacterium]